MCSFKAQIPVIPVAFSAKLSFNIPGIITARYFENAMISAAVLWMCMKQDKLGAGIDPFRPIRIEMDPRDLLFGPISVPHSSSGLPFWDVDFYFILFYFSFFFVLLLL